MKRALAAVVVLLALASCGRGLDEDAPGTTTSTSTTTTTTIPPEETGTPEVTSPLLVWADPLVRPAVADAAATFTTATGIDVDVSAVSLAEMERLVRIGPGPDLFAGSHTWLARLGPPGLAAELELEARLSEFEAVAVDAFAFRGDLRGVPYAMSTIALFYNTALSPEVPGAFSQIKNTCLGLRGELGGADTTTTQATTTTQPEPVGPAACVMVGADDVQAALTFLTAPGGYLYGEADGTLDLSDIGLASSGAAEGAGFLVEQVADDILTAAPDAATMVSEFTAGEAVFLIGDLDLAVALRVAGAPFEAAPLPIMSGHVPVPYVLVDGFMLAGRSRQSETASLFLSDYLASAPTMEALFAGSDALPAFVATTELVAADQIRSAFLSSAREGSPLPKAPGIEAVLAELAPVLSELYGEDPDIEDVLGRAADIAATLAAG